MNELELTKARLPSLRPNDALSKGKVPDAHLHLTTLCRAVTG